jgi:hypothetical protein
MAKSAFVFKVALSDRKSIWRRIAVRAGQTLDDLHEAIFDAFDRYDEHLYSFYFPKPGTKGRARLRNAIEVACPFSCDDPFDAPQQNAAKTTLNRLGLKRGQVFLYLFDFGDNWLHDVTVEEMDVPADEGEYPRILESRGESPPQYPDLDEE